MQIRRERTFRPSGVRRLPLVVMAVMALALLPAQPVAAGDGAIAAIHEYRLFFRYIRH